MIHHLPKAASMAAVCCLTACSILPGRDFTGDATIPRKHHTIQLSAVSLSRYDGKWYVSGGPPAQAVDCLEFTVDSPAGNAPAFEILSMTVVRKNHGPLAFQRLSREKENRSDSYPRNHELWVMAQPDRARPPEIPSGHHVIKIVYRVRGREYEAEWACEYKKGFKVVPWAFTH